MNCIYMNLHLSNLITVVSNLGWCHIVHVGMFLKAATGSVGHCDSSLSLAWTQKATQR